MLHVLSYLEADTLIDCYNSNDYLQDLFQKAHLLEKRELVLEGDADVIDAKWLHYKQMNGRASVRYLSLHLLLPEAPQAAIYNLQQPGQDMASALEVLRQHDEQVLSALKSSQLFKDAPFEHVEEMTYYSHNNIDYHQDEAFQWIGLASCKRLKSLTWYPDYHRFYSAAYEFGPMPEDSPLSSCRLQHLQIDLRGECVIEIDAAFTALVSQVEQLSINSSTDCKQPWVLELLAAICHTVEDITFYEVELQRTANLDLSVITFSKLRVLELMVVNMLNIEIQAPLLDLLIVNTGDGSRIPILSRPTMANVEMVDYQGTHLVLERFFTTETLHSLSKCKWLTIRGGYPIPTADESEREMEMPYRLFSEAAKQVGEYGHSARFKLLPSLETLTLGPQWGFWVGAKVDHIDPYNIAEEHLVTFVAERERLGLPPFRLELGKYVKLTTKTEEWLRERCVSLQCAPSVPTSTVQSLDPVEEP